MKIIGTKRILPKRVAQIIILTFCALVAIVVTYVMLFAYNPKENSLRALASVSMDIISLIMLIVLVGNTAFEKGVINRTTKLFIGLMLGNMLALFFDFLTWSSDGSLAYGDRTYIYTISSLCCGAILACFFVMYLGSYMSDVYNLTSALIRSKIYLGCNVVAFVVTVILGITGEAFVFENGHYSTGALYDGVTAIPVLTLILMTAYVVKNARVIGLHDIIAVTGYIFIMIAGALIESIYSFGSTYPGITIANIFIFVMLQNRVIARVRKQGEVLSEKITSQFEILESMAGIYSYVNLVDLENMTAVRFDVIDSEAEYLNIRKDPHTSLNKDLFEGVEKDLKDKFWAYTDLLTLNDRMKGEKIISADFCHKRDGWFRAQYIRMGDCVDEPIKKVIYAIRNIDEEKKNVEEWIRKSNTDELTGFYNRHAYEDDIAALQSGSIKDNMVYVSIDVNSLKMVNDSLGHEAGDEMIIGACDCLRQCFGSYGKLYRTGGDEFVAIIFADEAQLEEIKKDIEEITYNWHGSLIDSLAVSCGYVTQSEAKGMTIHQIAVLADKKMYEDKAKYYQKKGIDRRGQRDAHVALCALYTKILKINITDDTYQIIDMNEDERTTEKGFADSISDWLSSFGKSGQVHPDDLEGYLEKTELSYMRNYFNNNKNALHIVYRRRIGDDYVKVMMEIIPANDYSSKGQNLFLYVKTIE